MESGGVVTVSASCQPQDFGTMPCVAKKSGLRMVGLCACPTTTPENCTRRHFMKGPPASSTVSQSFRGRHASARDYRRRTLLGGPTANRGRKPSVCADRSLAQFLHGVVKFAGSWLSIPQLYWLEVQPEKLMA